MHKCFVFKGAVHKLRNPLRRGGGVRMLKPFFILERANGVPTGPHVQLASTGRHWTLTIISVDFSISLGE